jgi:glutamyl-tRNA reductase
MYSSAKTHSIINVRITHKTAHVPLLEAVSFKDKANAYAEMRSLDGVQESVLIQTCNRIELYLVTEDGYKTAKSTLQRHVKQLSTPLTVMRLATC